MYIIMNSIGQLGPWAPSAEVSALPAYVRVGDNLHDHEQKDTKAAEGDISDGSPPASPPVGPPVNPPVRRWSQSAESNTNRTAGSVRSSSEDVTHEMPPPTGIIVTIMPDYRDNIVTTPEDTVDTEQRPDDRTDIAENCGMRPRRLSFSEM